MLNIEMIIFLGWSWRYRRKIPNSPSFLPKLLYPQRSELRYNLRCYDLTVLTSAKSLYLQLYLARELLFGLLKLLNSVNSKRLGIFSCELNSDEERQILRSWSEIVAIFADTSVLDALNPEYTDTDKPRKSYAEPPASSTCPMFVYLVFCC